MRCTLNEKVLPRFDAGFYGADRLCTESAGPPPDHVHVSRQPMGVARGFEGTALVTNGRRVLT